MRLYEENLIYIDIIMSIYTDNDFSGNPFKDFNDDLSVEKAQEFLTLSVEDKLNEIKKLHLKYLGKYKYNYFLPQTGLHKYKFTKVERCMECDKYSRYLHYNEIRYDYDIEECNVFKNAYQATKWRKSLESDNGCLIYRYKRMYYAIQRNRWAYRQQSNFFQRYR